MKKLLVGAGLLLGLAFTQRADAQVRVGVNINIGDPPPVYYYDPYYYPPPRVIVARPATYYYYDRNRYDRRYTSYSRYKKHDNGLHKGWYKNKKYKGRH